VHFLQRQVWHTVHGSVWTSSAVLSATLTQFAFSPSVDTCNTVTTISSASLCSCRPRTDLCWSQRMSFHCSHWLRVSSDVMIVLLHCSQVWLITHFSQLLLQAQGDHLLLKSGNIRKFVRFQETGRKLTESQGKLFVANFSLGLCHCLVASCVYVYYAVNYDVGNGSLSSCAANSCGIWQCVESSHRTSIQPVVISRWSESSVLVQFVIWLPDGSQWKSHLLAPGSYFMTFQDLSGGLHLNGGGLRKKLDWYLCSWPKVTLFIVLLTCPHVCVCVCRCIYVCVGMRVVIVLVLLFVVFVVVVAEGGESGDAAMVGDNTVRFSCPELTHEGQWHHLAAVIHKASIMKNSSVSLFIDGNYSATQKVRSIDSKLANRCSRDWWLIFCRWTRSWHLYFWSENRNGVDAHFSLCRSLVNFKLSCLLLGFTSLDQNRFFCHFWFLLRIKLFSFSFSFIAASVLMTTMMPMTMTVSYTYI